MRSSSQGYDGAARAFHWLTALLVFAMFGLGWYMADLELTDPDKFRLYQVHKSLGIVIFALALLRLAWRLTHKAPAWPAHMAGWERAAAAGAHWALYGLILLQPLIGVLQSNAANFPIVFYGGFELPALIGPNETLADILNNLHHLFANVLAGMVLLHVGAALRHHIQLKDDVLRNMMPSPGLGAGVLVLTLAFLVPPFLLAGGSAPGPTPESVDAEAGRDGYRSEQRRRRGGWRPLDRRGRLGSRFPRASAGIAGARQVSTRSKHKIDLRSGRSRRIAGSTLT